jgi:hypothetical protein
MTVSRPRATGIAAMAAALGISAWLLATHDESTAVPPAATTPAPARTATDALPQGVLTAPQLRAAARRLGRIAYWAGPEPGRRYGLRRDEQNGTVAIDYYLPQGDRELTVATIPLAGAFARTKELAAQAGAATRDLAAGGIAWSPANRPLTAYVAFPGVDYVVELDAERPGLARRVAFAGRARALE